MVWGAGVVAVVGLLSRYAVDVGGLAVRSALHRPTPVPLLVVHVAAVATAAAALLAYGHVSLLALASGEPVLALGGVVALALLPAWFGDDGVLLGLVAVALLLPVLRVGPGRGLGRTPGDDTATGGWAWRGPPPPLPAMATPVLAPALSSAAAVGLAAAGWHVVGRFTGALVLDDSTYRSTDYSLTLGLGVVGVLSAAAVLGAGAAVLLLPPRWWALGLLGGPVAVLSGGACVLLVQWAAGCGLLPRAGPRDCSPPTVDAVATVLGQPLALSCVGVLLGVAALGASRGRTGATADGVRPSRPRVRVVGVVGLLLLAVPGLVATGFVATTEVEVVAGPGYVITVPPPWRTGPEQEEGTAPSLETINQRIRVDLHPATTDDGTTQGGGGREGPLVGGLRSRLVDERSEGPLVERSYQVETPSGPYRLRVVGAPGYLSGTGQEELDSLLSGVEWTG